MRIINSTFLFFIAFSLFSQEEIILKNSSFEDFPRLSKTPRGWYYCGAAGESEVDLHPVSGGTFKVETLPADGDTYVGMVVRENDTWEAIGQRLVSPLHAEKNYFLSAYLARSPFYMSLGRSQKTMGQSTNYATPAILRIWGGDGYCKRKELLGETSPIDHSDWFAYDFYFTPTENHQYILIEAFYKTPTLIPYNGNILVDFLTPIMELTSEESKTMKIDAIRLGNRLAGLATTAEKADEEKVEKKNPKIFRNQVTPEKLKPVVEGIPAKEKTFYKEHVKQIDFRRWVNVLNEEQQNSVKELAKHLKSSDFNFTFIFKNPQANLSIVEEQMEHLRTLLLNAGLGADKFSFDKTVENPVFTCESDDVKLVLY